MEQNRILRYFYDGQSANRKFEVNPSDKLIQGRTVSVLWWKFCLASITSNMQRTVHKITYIQTWAFI